MAAPPCAAHCFPEASAGLPKLAPRPRSHMMSPMPAGQQTACRCSAGEAWRPEHDDAQPVVALSLLPVQSAPTGPSSANWRGPGHVRPACRYWPPLCTGRWPGLEWPETGLQGRRHLETARRLITGVRKSSYSSASQQWSLSAALSMNILISYHSLSQSYVLSNPQRSKLQYQI